MNTAKELKPYERWQPSARRALKRTLLLGLLALGLIQHQAFGGAVLTSLFSFDGTNGAMPEASLAQGSDGALYGTTIAGGTNGISNGGDGTVFRITTNGTFTTLAFPDRAFAASPQAGLVEGSDGSLYGTTLFGGLRDWGVVFKISFEGAFATVASLQWPDAEYANGLVEGPLGLFYGTAYYGGTNGGHGSVFKVSTNGIVTPLAGFNGTNGAHPQAPLLRAKDGNFYDTTVEGGSNGGFGTVFKVTPAGDLTSMIGFNGTNGARPLGTLQQDAMGTLYGTTSKGGIGFDGSSFSGNGTVFKITPTGELVTLHWLAGYPGDGASPVFGALAWGTDGNLYGTTEGGGAYGGGAILRISPDGASSLIYSFSAPVYPGVTNLDGYAPSGGLVRANDGSFYGATAQGGLSGKGTIFRLTLTPDPPKLRVSASPGDAISLSWDTVKGKRYHLQRSADLQPGSWGDLGAVITATNTTATASDALAPAGHRFYRIVVLE